MSVRAISAYRFCSRVSIRRERAARDHERTFRCILSLSTLSDWFRPDIEYIISIECHRGISVSSVSSVATEVLQPAITEHLLPVTFIYYAILPIANNSEKKAIWKKNSNNIPSDKAWRHCEPLSEAIPSQDITKNILSRYNKYNTLWCFFSLFRILFPRIHYILI